MPLILLIPLLVAGLFAMWVLLLPVAVIQRYRFGKARRRVPPWVVRINAWLLAVSAFAFVAGGWVLGHWVDGALVDATVGLGPHRVGPVAGLARRTWRRDGGLGDARRVDRCRRGAAWVCGCDGMGTS